ncbi:tetratricopeptide repeat protein [Parvicella tangerina]|uniref:tetratricopeptide repeat protein n=1 Tax=Parvicella tangerina TaxID=2829795 RepID=UPI00215C99C1|nr:tetratricopeptide repeat protein [Parvicella tangerina]
MKHILVLISVLPILVSAQVDSLLNEAENANSDTARLRNLVLVTEYCAIPDIEYYANQCIHLSDSLIELGLYDEEKLLFFKSTAINNLGFMHHAYAEYQPAIAQYEKSIQIYTQINDSLGLARSLNNIAMVYKDAGDTEKAIALLQQANDICAPMGDYDLHNITLTNFGTIYTQKGDINKAIEYLFKAIKLQDKENDAYGLAHSYNTLASLYHSQEDFENAEVYFEKAIEQSKQANDFDILASCYNNLGFIHDLKEKDSLALVYYEKSLDLRLKINDRKGEAECYSNMGSYFLEHGDTLKGLDLIEQSIEIREETGEAEGLSNSYQKIAGIMLDRGELNKALDYGEKSYALAKQIGYSEDIRNSSLVLSQIQAQLGNFKEAYQMHVAYLAARDSLFNKENQKNIIQEQVDYEYAKKHLADSLNTAKTLEIAQLEKEHQQKELDKANQRNIAMLIGIVLLVVVVILAFFAYQNKKRSEQTISQQKIKVEEQKQLLEESNKEILDSITYAHRIQTAILPPEDLFKKHLPNSFVFYRPKDIVAGDFYWLEEIDDTVIFAAADCTGHGVPGALVSMICSNALTKVVMEDEITDPGKLLDRTRDLVIQTFAKSNEDVKDGMDISLCRLKGRSLWWAGANNPLWIIKNQTNEIVEIKGNKQPVGLYSDPKPFETHYLSLERGDTVYLFSDGYHDQFGGEKGKKLKTGSFKKLLLQNNHLEMPEIIERLDFFFNDWRGDFEQVDDVCVIGIRV